MVGIDLMKSKKVVAATMVILYSAASYTRLA
jgi:hypothetical protein